MPISSFLSLGSASRVADGGEGEIGEGEGEAVEAQEEEIFGEISGGGLSSSATEGGVFPPFWGKVET